MRESGKRQGINRWSNSWSWSTDFHRRKSKWEIKCKDVNKDNNLTNFTFSIFFVIYKREEAEISNEPSWYDKEQLPSMTSTHIFSFNEVHFQQVSGPHVTSKVNKHNIRFPRDEGGNIDVKTGKYDKKINKKSPPSSMNKGGCSASV